MLTVTILDTNNGSTRKEYSNTDVYYWTEGNGSCDCNRSLLFDVTSGCCNGSKRYLITDVDGDLEGLTKEDFLAEANQTYPEELVRKFNLPVFAM